MCSIDVCPICSPKTYNCFSTHKPITRKECQPAANLCTQNLSARLLQTTYQPTEENHPFHQTQNFSSHLTTEHKTHLASKHCRSCHSLELFFPKQLHILSTSHIYISIEQGLLIHSHSLVLKPKDWSAQFGKWLKSPHSV